MLGFWGMCSLEPQISRTADKFQPIKADDADKKQDVMKGRVGRPARLYIDSQAIKAIIAILAEAAFASAKNLRL